MSHLFNTKNFREIICVVFEEETKKFLKIMDKRSKSGEIFDLQELFYRFTLDSFGKITFGLDFKSLTNLEKPVPFATNFDFAQRAIIHRFNNPFWKITELFTEEGRKLRKACKWLSEFAYKIIENRRNDPKDPKDILNLFMNSQFDDGRKLTDKELKDVILNFMIAGMSFIKKKFFLC